MQDRDKVMDRVIELSRAVERAKAELDSKRYELLMFIQEIGNPQEVKKAKARVAKEAIAGLQEMGPPSLKVSVRRGALDVKSRNERRRGVPTITHQDAVLHCLRMAKKPISTSTVMEKTKLDYAKTLWILEYLEKAKRAKVASRTSVKHRGKLIIVRRWAVA
jgi:hypothetical protein